MGWNDPIDAYCERLGPAFWAEPVNAVTNLAFLIAALVMARRLRGQRMPLAWLMVGVLTCIGLGSFAFHTFATPWAAMLDVVPIGVFILVYLYAANRHFWQLSRGWSIFGVALFIPYAALLVPLFDGLGWLGSSAGYAPVPLLIALYGVALRARARQTARGLLIGALVLVVSLTFRTLDLPLCGVFPFGTHVFWHVLNGIMLGWMIEVYRRHMVARAADENA
ncbi:MAG: ceramidase domain-containing protein [Paracoccaceae bacterium]